MSVLLRLPFPQIEDEGWTRLNSKVLDSTFGVCVFLALDYQSSHSFITKVLKSFPSLLSSADAAGNHGTPLARGHHCSALE